MLLSNPCSPLISLSIFQLQNEKRRLEKDLEEIKRQKEAQEEENERMKQEVASLRYVCATILLYPAIFRPFHFFAQKQKIQFEKDFTTSSKIS